jgi:hypothetical protein
MKKKQGCRTQLKQANGQLSNPVRYFTPELDRKHRLLTGIYSRFLYTKSAMFFHARSTRRMLGSSTCNSFNVIGTAAD